jgi:hypothetical protein
MAKKKAELNLRSPPHNPKKPIENNLLFLSSLGLTLVFLSISECMTELKIDVTIFYKK